MRMLPLESIELLRDWFDRNAGKWRVVALVSST